MKNDRGKDIDPDLVINQLLSQDQSAKHGAGQLNIKHIRERFFSALKEISHLEKALEEKNTQLAIAARERDRLIHALNKVFEEKKKLHERVADFDVLRNMEIAEFKQSAEKIVDQLNRIHEEKYELLEDIFEKDRAIDDLKKANKKKERQIEELQANMDTAFETLKGSESRYKELEANYKVIEQEKDNLREKLNAAIDQQETGVSEEAEEYKRLLEISTSEKEAVERQLSGMREQMASDIAGYQTTIEKLSAKKDELSLNLTELNKKLSTMIYDLTQKAEKEAEYFDKVKKLNSVIVDMKIIIAEKIDENTSLKDEISSLNSLLDEKGKEEERVNAGKANLEKDLQLKGQEIEDLKSQYDADIKRVASEMEISTAEKAELETGIKGIKEELERHKKSLDIANTEKETIEGQLKEAMEKISSLEDKNNDYLSELSSKDYLISELKMQRAGDIEGYQTTIEKLTAEKDEIERRLSETLKDKDDELNLKLTETNKELILLKEENEALKGKLSSIAAHDLTHKTEAEAEARNKIDELNKAITDLRATAAGVPEKSKFYLFSGLAVCIFVIAGLWLFNIIETKRFDAEMSKLNKQKIELQQKIMPPPLMPAAISVGEEILDAMEKSPKWTSAISEILAVVPEDVSLSSIESSEIRRGEKEDKGIKQVDIKGFSTTELGIADLVSALKASHFFYDVEMVSSQKGEKDIAFELKTRLKKT